MHNEVYTEQVATKAGPNASPRAKVVFSSLIRHLHTFAREVELTTEEWLMACDSLVQAGQASTPASNEMILISGVLGLESLIDSMTHERLQKGATSKQEKSGIITDSSLLGPFYRANPPSYKNGESIVLTQEPNDILVHVSGTVKNIDGSPIVGAQVDIWHTGSHGFYDSQIFNPKDHKTLEFNWRGRFRTDDQGRYDLYCLRPTAYPIPNHYMGGRILTALDRTLMRPAHIHFYLQAEGYQPLITQIYDSACPYVENDAVFAVKDSLVVDFKDAGDNKTELEFNIVIAEIVDDAPLNG